MNHLKRSPLLRAATVAGVCIALSACNAAQRLSEVGKVPELTQVSDPTATPGYQPIVLPMPRPQPIERQANSLWRPGARAFLKDQRATNVGDILTVLIEIDDEAQISNRSSRSRNNRDEAGLTNFLGLESKLSAILPDAVNPGSLVDFDSELSNQGSGSVRRNEAINLKIAALVTQVLPNGNMVIQGRQEVRVNFEVRELLIAGVIRPEDITSENAISYEKIAEARIAYGGRGQITDVQQPRYGQQVFDIIWPW